MVEATSNVLVTGSAGFIGFHLSKELLIRGFNVLGIDNLNEYYEPSLKENRLKQLDKASSTTEGNFTFLKMDLRNSNSLNELFKNYKINSICHLAAQAGVRYSIDYPHTYIENNITATINLLEMAKNHNISDFIFASTSSVYGLSKDMPFDESTPINTPISTYSSTKRACELLCYTYHNLYGIRFRIMRFFTVYGPWGRPDMALFKFTKAILKNEPIKVFNNGEMKRDFTYIDDIISGFVLALENNLDFEIFNLGNGKPVHLLDFINIIEKELGIESEKIFHPLQQGDVTETWANTDKAQKILGYKPKIEVNDGVSEFVNWYKAYYSVS